MAIKTYLQALNDAMRQEMERDENVFIIGEDVGKFGGCFGVTQGLFDQFGRTPRARHPHYGKRHCGRCRPALPQPVCARGRTDVCGLHRRRP